MNMMSKRTMSIFGILIFSGISFLRKFFQIVFSFGYYSYGRLPVMIGNFLFFISVLLLIAAAIVELLIIYGKIKNINLLRTVEYGYLVALVFLEISAIAYIFNYSFDPIDLISAFIIVIASLLDIAFYVIIFMDVFGMSSRARKFFDQFWFAPLALIGLNAIMAVMTFIWAQIYMLINNYFYISNLISSTINTIFTIIGLLIVPCYIMRIKFGHDEHYYPDNYRN